jgi:hypothetical protein
LNPKFTFYVIFIASMVVALLQGFREIQNGFRAIPLSLLVVYSCTIMLLARFGFNSIRALELLREPTNIRELQRGKAQIVLSQSVAVALLVIYLFTLLPIR